MSNRLEHRSVDLTEIKLIQESDAVGSLEGYGSVFNNLDEQDDIIAPGAFRDSLAAWQARKKWPKMLLQHGGGMFGGGALDGIPVGQWTEMREDRKGLKVKGRLFALNTERGQYIYEGLRSGELDGLSIGFRVVTATQGGRDDDFDRKLEAIDLWEVSIVTFPANRDALIGAVKNLSVRQIRDLEGLLGERGVSQTQAVRAVAAFKEWLEREARAPEIVPREAVAPDPIVEALAAAELLGGSMILGAIDSNLRG